MSKKYVKRILMNRYTDGKEINTTVDNYGRVIKIEVAERALFEGILNTAKATGAALKTVWKFSVALKKQEPDALVQRLLKKDNPSQVDLSDYLPDLDGTTVFDLGTLKALRTLTYRSRELLEGGYRPDNEPLALFWECFYERVRSDEFSNAPSRSTCFFLFSDLDSAVDYDRKVHTGPRHNYLFCNVVATSTLTAFSADMTLLNEVVLEQTFASAAEQIRRYWRQERSEKPLMEVLFQGTACLGERISLNASQS